MLTAAALVPSPPLLVPELAGAAATETDRFRQAALEVSARLGGACDEWTVIGVAEPGSPGGWLPAASSGTFAGFGVDVRVRLDPGLSGDDDAEADRSMPLAALIAGWLRGAGAPAARARVLLLTADTPPADCARIGAELRAELDSRALPQGLLVVADGANTLTDKAPGAFDSRSGAVQSAVDEALEAGDCAAIEALDADLCAELGLSGRAAWQTLSAAFGGGCGGPRKSETLYTGAPFGVGYHVGMWMA
ncbi:hypothetical protein ERC79_21475 [Rhodococcus sp. ABRD24]|uniref:hypothetical protein n=1 Tax=Rhodococcus sp. ABRD24 TaxID=2507582 RepID=UPI001039D101|nr:hypothetical protein [Rhodococcus sp. ABRD24]QBJ98226.1 hypothetical protein ERC79_21475 [Rhodococcus sp. ABRD24]